MPALGPPSAGNIGAWQATAIRTRYIGGSRALGMDVGVGVASRDGIRLALRGDARGNRINITTENGKVIAADLY